MFSDVGIRVYLDCKEHASKENNQTDYYSCGTRYDSRKLASTNAVAAGFWNSNRSRAVVNSLVVTLNMWNSSLQAKGDCVLK